MPRPLLDYKTLGNCQSLVLNEGVNGRYIEAYAYQFWNEALRLLQVRFPEKDRCNLAIAPQYPLPFDSITNDDEIVTKMYFTDFALLYSNAVERSSKELRTLSDQPLLQAMYGSHVLLPGNIVLLLVEIKRFELGGRPDLMILEHESISGFAHNAEIKMSLARQQVRNQAQAYLSHKPKSTIVVALAACYGLYSWIIFDSSVMEPREKFLDNTYKPTSPPKARHVKKNSVDGVDLQLYQRAAERLSGVYHAPSHEAASQGNTSESSTGKKRKRSESILERRELLPVQSGTEEPKWSVSKTWGFPDSWEGEMQILAEIAKLVPK
ncbi:hypothetical protein C8Q78DRAFT_990592 [Trametes maxima]|nr:hypothetical protein C8Q78DRAFT_990592 [Trametes maxima]